MCNILNGRPTESIRRGFHNYRGVLLDIRKQLDYWHLGSNDLDGYPDRYVPPHEPDRCQKYSDPVLVPGHLAG